jgi:NhaP-type Na+/H+ or K+/H+ antiporter
MPLAVAFALAAILSPTDPVTVGCRLVVGRDVATPVLGRIIGTLLQR